MALKKTTYVSGNTIITAENLNDIQDSVIALENTERTSISGGAVTGGDNALVTKEVLDATSQLIMDEIPTALKTHMHLLLPVRLLKCMMVQVQLR